MAGNHPRAALLRGLALLAIALAFRIWTVQSTVTFDYAPLSDDRLFEEIGQTLADSGRYAQHPDSPPTARRSPLLPILLAATYQIVGHRVAVAQGLMLLISALTAPLTMLLGQTVGDQRTGMLAGLTVALDPFAWVFAGVFYTEALYTLLFTASLLLLLRVMRAPLRRDLILLGVALGLGALARPNGLTTAVVCVALLPLVSQQSLAIRLRQAALVSVIVVLFLAPWIIRNLLVFERLIPTTSETGYVLLGFYNEICLEYRCLDWVPPERLPEFSEYHLSELNDMERYDKEMELALSFLKANPAAYLALVPGKMGHFWAQDSYVPKTTYRSEPSQLLFTLQRTYYWMLFPTGILGMVALQLTRRRQAFLVLGSFVVVFTLTTLVFWGNARLRVPLHPLLAVSGAYGVTAIYDRLKG